MSRLVPVFFYGGFASRDVLKSKGVEPASHVLGHLPGWDIRIGSLATLVPSESSSVYGALSSITHEEVDALYGPDRLPGYVPEPVLAFSASIPVLALAYVSYRDDDGRPAAEYVETIVSAGRELGFPGWYQERLESFI